MSVDQPARTSSPATAGGGILVRTRGAARHSPPLAVPNATAVPAVESRSPAYDPAPGQHYLTSVAGLAPRVLRALLDRGDLTRGGITKIEQKIQDFMRTAFLPFVGQWHVPDYIASTNRAGFQSLRPLAEAVRMNEQSFNFIGAHYRSRLSVRGRRTAFASRQEVFHASLDKFVGRSLLRPLGAVPDGSMFQQLWDAVYLEQYFRLCGVNVTFSEWALHRQQLRPIAVMTTRRSLCSVTLESLAGGVDVPTVKVAKGLTRQLLQPTTVKTLWRAVARAFAQALGDAPEAFERLQEGAESAPDIESIQSWFRLVHRANALASRILEDDSVRADLAARAAYVAGLLLYGREHGSFRAGLAEYLGSAQPVRGQAKPDAAALSSVGEFVRVLQSLRFYQECYGESCITVPDEQPSTIRGSEIDAAALPPIGAGSKCSLTLFWGGPDSLPPVLPKVLEATSSLFSHALSEGELTIGQEVPSRGIESPDVARLAGTLQQFTKGAVGARAIAKVLILAEDLSRCLHESRPRAFTFLLGSPQWLISDLRIEHELVGAVSSFQLAERAAEPEKYQSTLALLEGNSSFLQAEDLCLFVACPAEPLEVTHIVKVPRLEMMRRKLLCSFTAERPGLLAVVTHGNGRGEVICDGEVQGVLRPGHSWAERSREYFDFGAGLESVLNKLVGKRKAGEIAAVLRPVIQDLSEEPGVGALFVVAKKGNIVNLLNSSSKLTEVLDSVDGQRLLEMPPEVLFQLAQDDGATLICCDDLCVWGRRHLEVPVIPNLEKEWKAHGPMQWKHWYKTKTWGTRRRTGLAVSFDLREEGVVIVISADGPVDLLQGGRGVAEFSE